MEKNTCTFHRFAKITIFYLLCVLYTLACVKNNMKFSRRVNFILTQNWEITKWNLKCHFKCLFQIKNNLSMDASAREEGELSDEEDNGRSRNSHFPNNSRNFPFVHMPNISSRHDVSKVNLPHPRFALPSLADLRLRSPRMYPDTSAIRGQHRPPIFGRRIPPPHAPRFNSLNRKPMPIRNINVKQPYPQADSILLEKIN